jgi:hypothetical protein
MGVYSGSYDLSGAFTGAVVSQQDSLWSDMVELHHRCWLEHRLRAFFRARSSGSGSYLRDLGVGGRRTLRARVGLCLGKRSNSIPVCGHSVHYLETWLNAIWY